ncbi:FadR/GntR family transcriptional regulator [Angustibacter aerolatus]
MSTRDTDVDAPTGLHERVLATIGPQLVSGELPEGSVLRIDEIVQQHGVSRTVARDVVKVLESLRVATSRRRVGVTVRPRREWNVFDPRMIRWRLDGARREGQLRSLSELRRGVEPVAAALAATRADDAQVAALTAAVTGMAATGRAGDLETYLGHDVDFHRTLLEASGNEMFAALAPVVAEVLSGRTHHHLMPAHPEPAAIQLHADVAAAVRAGDAATAERSMRAIVDEAQQAIEQAFPG